MSDYKALFKAAQAQRLSAKPTKEQLRALKASKQAATGGQVAKAAPSSAPAVGKAASSKPGAPGALPDDFFDKGPSSAAATAAASAAPGSQPSALIAAPGSSRRAGAAAEVIAGPGQPGAPAATPAGFFDDMTADAKARGIKIPDAADKEAAFKAFAADVEEELKEQETAEEQEATEAAADRLAREAFEQEQRVNRLEALRAMVRKRPAEDADPGSASAVSIGDVEVDAALAAAVPAAKKRRAIDVLKDVPRGAEDSSDEDDLADDDSLLNWRAKAV